MINIHHFFPKPNKRFKGGITHLAEFLVKKWEHEKFILNPVNTYFFQPSKRSMGKFSLATAGNIFWIALKIILTNKQDFIHFHTSKKNGLLKDLLAISIAELFTQPKILLHIHFSDLENTLPNHFRNWSIKQLKKKKIVCLTKKMQNDLIKQKIDSNQISYLPNFYRRTLTQQYNKEPFSISFVGSIDERKGIFSLIKSLINLQNKNIILHVCGTPANRTLAKKWSKIKKTASIKIVDHGYLATEDLEEILSKSLLFVLPSKQEGMPLSVLDAMALGCICLVTRLDYLQDIDPKHMALSSFLQDNWKDFEDQLEMLLSKNQISTEKIKNSLQLVQAFSFENFSKRLESIYQNFCTKSTCNFPS